MGLGEATLGWRTRGVKLLLTVSIWVSGLPVRDMFHCPHPLAFVGFFIALTVVTIFFFPNPHLRMFFLRMFFSIDFQRLEGREGGGEGKEKH